MIPKIIHYCWFGKGEKSTQVKKCIESWNRILIDYQIIEWNEENFDVGVNAYTKQAYENKKYAFVSDVARLYALLNYGGSLIRFYTYKIHFANKQFTYWFKTQKQVIKYLFY